MNPELPSIIKYAYLKGVTLVAYNGTNFNTVSDETLVAMVRYCFKGFTVSIDGGSQAVYSQYRQKGDFNTVISNLKKLIVLKKKYNSPYPEIRWQYIIMQHNEEDVVNAKRIAQELDIPIDFKLSWDESYKPIKRDLLRKETGLQVFTREEYRKHYSKVYLGYLQCRQMFLSPQINWDGRLLGCCGLYKEDYGVNVFEIGLRKALQSKSFIYAKELLINEGNSNHINTICPCDHCDKRSQMLLTQEIFDPFSRVNI